MVKKLISSLLIAASVIAILPIGASAEWKEDSAGWWYADGNSYYTGWKQIDGTWYYFGKDGYMRRGWMQDGKWRYYLQDNGSMATGAIWIKGKEYDFDSSGRWIFSYDSTGILPSSTTSAGVTTSTGIKSTNASVPPSQDKLKMAAKLNWFYENGNTYFKINDNEYLKGVWNVNGTLREFDKNGVLQREYITPDGKKYLLGGDGRVTQCISDDSTTLFTGFAVETKSNSDNSVVKLDDDNIMTISSVYSKDQSKNGINAEGVKVSGKTLYCRTNQDIKLGNIKVIGTDPEITSFPSLVIKTQFSTENIISSSVNLSMEDGFYKNIQTEIFAKKPGNTTVTIDVNGTKTSFDVVVTE